MRDGVTEFETRYICAAQYARKTMDELIAAEEEIDRLKKENRELLKRLLTNEGGGDIIGSEERFNPYHDDRGRFTSGGGGGYSGGNKSVDKSESSGIIEAGSDEVTISSIEKPIEQKHTGKGNPNAILHSDMPLNNRQQKLLDALPEYDSRTIVPKNMANMADLSALTAKTGDEFAMFTKGDKRLIVRGKSNKVQISQTDAKELAQQGYKWSGHTHPGLDVNCLTPSKGDKLILRCFEQETSVIYNSKGQFLTFGKED